MYACIPIAILPGKGLLGLLLSSVIVFRAAEACGNVVGPSPVWRLGGGGAAYSDPFTAWHTGVRVGSGAYLCGGTKGGSPGSMWLLHFLGGPLVFCLGYRILELAVGFCFLAPSWLQLCFEVLCHGQGAHLIYVPCSYLGVRRVTLPCLVPTLLYWVAELAVYMLSPRASVEFVVIASPVRVSLLHQIEWIFLPPGEGEFAVDSDRTSVQRLMNATLKKKKKKRVCERKRCQWDALPFPICTFIEDARRSASTCGCAPFRSHCQCFCKRIDFILLQPCTMFYLKSTPNTFV